MLETMIPACDFFPWPENLACRLGWYSGLMRPASPVRGGTLHNAEIIQARDTVAVDTPASWRPLQALLLLPAAFCRASTSSLFSVDYSSSISTLQALTLRNPNLEPVMRIHGSLHGHFAEKRLADESENILIYICD